MMIDIITRMKPAEPRITSSQNYAADNNSRICNRHKRKNTSTNLINFIIDKVNDL